MLHPERHQLHATRLMRVALGLIPSTQGGANRAGHVGGTQPACLNPNAHTAPEVLGAWLLTARVGFELLPSSANKDLKGFGLPHRFGDPLENPRETRIEHAHAVVPEQVHDWLCDTVPKEVQKCGARLSPRFDRDDARHARRL